MTSFYGFVLFFVCANLAYADFEIYVKTTLGSTITIRHLKPETKISDIKKIIAKRKKIPTSEGLIYNGRGLDDDHALSDYGIADKSLLRQYLRLKAGAPFKTIDITKNWQERPTSNGPEWRSIRPGFSVTGRCSNSDCVAHNDEVVSKKIGNAWTKTIAKLVKQTRIMLSFMKPPLLLKQ